MPEATVSGALAGSLFELAVIGGADRQQLARRSGLSLWDVRTAERLPLQRFLALMRTAKALTGDAALALRFGEAISLGSFARLGHGRPPSGSTPDCMAQLCRHLRLMADIDPARGDELFAVVPRASEIWLVDQRSDVNGASELTEITFAQLIGWARRDGGANWVKAIEFTHPEPEHRPEYDRIFQVPLRFGASANALLIGAALSEPSGPDPICAAAPQEVWDAVVREAEPITDTRGQVERLLVPALHTGDGHITYIASRLGIGRHTLYRRLRAEGATFEAILDDVRRRMARHYLDVLGASVKETAFLLGFSEPAAFSRAYKRWTGASRGRRRGDSRENGC